MSAQLPAGWRWSALGELAEVVRGVTYKKGQAIQEARPGYVPLLRSGNVSTTLRVDEGLVFVPRELVRDAQFLRPGDIVVSTSNSRELVGKSAQLMETWAGTFGAFCSVVRPGKEVDARYLGLFLKSPLYRRRISEQSAAVNNIANIRMGHLAGMQVPLPPESEQVAIVAAVERWLQAIEEGAMSLARALGGLQQFRAASLTEAFNYATRPLNEVAEVQSGVAKKSNARGATVERSYIRTANVQALRLDLTEVKRILVTPAQDQKHRLQPDDVLILEGGDADKVGRGWIWKGEVPDCLHQNHVFAVRTHSDALLSRYLAYYVNAPQARRYFLSVAKQTVNLASINKTNLKELPVPLPPVADQQATVEYLDRQLAACDAAERELQDRLADAEHLRRSILHHAMTGWLRPPKSPETMLTRPLRPTRPAAALVESKS